MNNEEITYCSNLMEGVHACLDYSKQFQFEKPKENCHCLVGKYADTKFLINFHENIGIALTCAQGQDENLMEVVHCISRIEKCRPDIAYSIAVDKPYSAIEWTMMIPELRKQELQEWAPFITDIRLLDRPKVLVKK